MGLNVVWGGGGALVGIGEKVVEFNSGLDLFSLEEEDYFLLLI